jgi:hypothetical protein
MPTTEAGNYAQWLHFYSKNTPQSTPPKIKLFLK